MLWKINLFLSSDENFESAYSVVRVGKSKPVAGPVVDFSWMESQASLTVCDSLITAAFYTWRLSVITGLSLMTRHPLNNNSVLSLECLSSANSL